MISPLEARYYRRRLPLTWWTRRRSYMFFILRELSSVFVVVFVVELLFLVRAVAHGPAAYQGYLDTFRYGMPPHGGFAIGLERWVGRLVEAPNIREVTLFPRDLHRLSP